MVGKMASLLLGLLPVVAHLQGMLPLPPFHFDYGPWHDATYVFVAQLVTI